MSSGNSGLFIFLVIVIMIIAFMIVSKSNENDTTKTTAGSSVSQVKMPEAKSINSFTNRAGHFWHGEDSEGNYYIDLKTLIVHTRLDYCPDSWKREPEIKIIVPTIKRDGTVTRTKVSARKCEGGKLLLIKDMDYNMMVRSIGNVLGQTADWYDYKHLGVGTGSYLDRYFDLQVKSKFKLFGYNVGAADNFSAKYRQTVLMYMIESGLTTISEAVGFLEFNITNHRNRENMKRAVQKWMEDRAFLLQYRYDKSKINWVTKNNHPV